MGVDGGNLLVMGVERYILTGLRRIGEGDQTDIFNLI